MLSLALDVLIALSSVFGASDADAAPPRDPFVGAVGVALTGAPDADIRPLDWRACRFEVNGQVFRLGAVDPATVRVRPWERDTVLGTMRRVAVTFSGADGAVVYERTDRALEDVSPADDAAIRLFKQTVKSRRPELFHDRRVALREQTVTLPTSDLAAVEDAWRTVTRTCAAPGTTH
ncbi:hypothetical protein A33M_0081 [Rhodovulum sp. PH10]|uniref:hypothetical protein n=1 Tax=Rhodovulum sp. PH10 TaxID=1187851 RepID=UPI00027C1DA0|nr:hypothetical protein [Rhodovulum sp. PH10]EJW13224.1 hypothetical protein A33M_0081 [Rhodovulum sp. PH10]